MAECGTCRSPCPYSLATRHRVGSGSTERRLTELVDSVPVAPGIPLERTDKLGIAFAVPDGALGEIDAAS